MESFKRNQYSLLINGEEKKLQLDQVFCIGYTGRNKEKTRQHVKELAEIGVPEPEEIPALYPVRDSSLSQGGKMDVIGDQTSGEAEIVLIFGESKDEVYITVGSDHTDRGLETVDINKSKQVCDKPFASKAWKLADVIDHWDELELSSQIRINGKWEDYQKDAISAIIPFNEIIGYLEEKKVPLKHSIVFSGTVPLKEGFKYGDKFSMTFTDPVKEDKITTEYDIKNLVAGG